MNWSRQVRSWHKWISIAVGIQLLAWTTGGLIFTLEPIDVVHGDTKLAPATPPPPLPAEGLMPLPDARALVGPVELASARLTWMRERWVWELQPAGERAPLLVDAQRKIRLEPIDATEAEAIARSRFAGPDELKGMERIDTASGEYREKPVPAWKATFADDDNSHLYINAHTGGISAVRTDIWRRFDWFWMLHIMSYETREGFDHPLLTGAAVLGVSTAFTGLWLAVLVLWPRQRKRPRPPGPVSG